MFILSKAIQENAFFWNPKVTCDLRDMYVKIHRTGRRYQQCIETVLNLMGALALKGLQ